ncbi:MAG: pyridoxal-phosphate dependent enzyme [Actinomycetota bacterium]|nr:pyridoxal-phosphate dependent enzyme [Actinomycetota bacterium]MDD5668324.1 pyridoxal-phosphate dependent enzyme [Actinomycetota bacterium]
MQEEPALFRRFPRLRDVLLHVALGEWPTPVERMRELEEAHGLPGFYVKRDDLSSKAYGGNKVRKLEFVLADALARKCDGVMTMGAAGSNHVLATAIHGKSLGLSTTALLFDQTCAEYVRRNLLMDYRSGVRMVWAHSIPLIPLAFLREMTGARLRGERLYWLGPGGSSPLGCLGYVNAGLELAEQVEEGVLPEPGFVVTAMGTHGTSAGLWLGLRLSGLRSRVVGVAVVETAYCNAALWARLVNRTAALLNRLDPGIRAPQAGPSDLVYIANELGRGYAHLTPADVKAVREARELEGLQLEGTYTGKALAAALEMGRGLSGDESVLFVNTYNSVDFSPQIAGTDYRLLSKPFHRFFEMPCRALEYEM